MPHILLVEDTPDVRQVLTMALESEAHTVEMAATRATGQALISDRPFDLMIADVLLPDGDSFDLTEIADRRNIPSLLITGDLETSNRMASQGRPCLTKPFTVDALLAAVAAVIGRAAA